MIFKISKLFVIMASCLICSISSFAVEKPKHDSGAGKPKAVGAKVTRDEPLVARIEELKQSIQKLSDQVGSETAQKSEDVRANLKRELEESSARFQELSGALAKQTSKHGQAAAKGAATSIRELGEAIARLGTSLSKKIETNDPVNATKNVRAEGQEDYPDEDTFPELED